MNKKEIKAKEKELGIKPGKCGSNWSEWIVPDRPVWMWFISLRWCCRAHDIAYHVGGTEDDRLLADDQFKADIIATYKKSWLWRFKTFRKRARATAGLYYNCVRKYGGDKFNYKEGE